MEKEKLKILMDIIEKELLAMSDEEFDAAMEEAKGTNFYKIIENAGFGVLKKLNNNSYIGRKSPLKKGD